MLRFLEEFSFQVLTSTLFALRSRCLLPCWLALNGLQVARREDLRYASPEVDPTSKAAVGTHEAAGSALPWNGSPAQRWRSRSKGEIIFDGTSGTGVAAGGCLGGRCGYEMSPVAAYRSTVGRRIRKFLAVWRGLRGSKRSKTQEKKNEARSKRNSMMIEVARTDFRIDNLATHHTHTILNRRHENE